MNTAIVVTAMTADSGAAQRFHKNNPKPAITYAKPATKLNQRTKGTMLPAVALSSAPPNRFFPPTAMVTMPNVIATSRTTAQRGRWGVVLFSLVTLQPREMLSILPWRYATQQGITRPVGGTNGRLSFANNSAQPPRRVALIFASSRLLGGAAKSVCWRAQRANRTSWTNCGTSVGCKQSHYCFRRLMRSTTMRWRFAFYSPGVRASDSKSSAADQEKAHYKDRLPPSSNAKKLRRVRLHTCA
jgi:hypothetical protein